MPKKSHFLGSISDATLRVGVEASHSPTNMTITMSEPAAVSGREVWEVIHSSGVITTVSSTASSNTIMDEAVLRYADALKRLAKR